MALSRYSVLPEQRVLSTYVRPDLQFAAKALMAKQGAYDEAEQYQLSTEDSFAKFATRNVDLGRKNQLVKQYTAAAQDVLSKYNGDYSQAMPTLRKLARGVAQDEFWTRASDALTREKDLRAAQKRIMEKGGNPLVFNDDATRKAIYQGGSYVDVDYDVQEQLDYTKPKASLMEGIAKDSRLSGLSFSKIAGVLQHGSAKGVDASKVLSVAKQMIAPYLQTPEGMQEVRYLRQQNPNISNDDIVKRIGASLASIGSKQVGWEQDQDYMADPSFTKASASVKETDLTSIVTSSPAVDVASVAGLSADMFTRKDRGTGGKLFMNPAAIAADPKAAEAYFAKNKQGKNMYAGLDETQRSKAANMLMDRWPKLATKLKKGTITDAEMDAVAPTLRKQLEALSNLKVGSAVISIDPARDYGSYGKGEQGLTKALLGSDNLSNISSGKLINTVVYTPDGQKLSGGDFIRKVLIPAQQAAKEGKMDATARITGQFSAANPYSLLTNDDAFGDAKQLTIGDQQYVVAGLDEVTTTATSRKLKDGTITKSSSSNNVSALRRAKATPITNAMRNVGQATSVTLGNASFRLKWNSDGTFTFPDQVDPTTGKEGFTTTDPEAVLDSYLENL